MQPLPAALDTWDTGMTLHLFREVSVDVRRLREDCALSKDVSVRLAAIWHSAGTSLRSCGFVSELIGPEQDVKVSLDVPGNELAAELVLTTQIVVGGFSSPSSRATPSRPGTVLWSDECQLILEGRAPRFPIEVLDFSEHAWLPAQAAWYLDWEEDLDCQVLGGPRLLLNSKNAGVSRMLAQPADDAAAVAILDAMRFDVTVSMLSAIARSDLQRADEYERGSTGHALVRLLRHMFPDVPLETVAELARNDGRRFAADIQHRLLIFARGGRM